MKILIVDDENLIRLSLKRVAEASGHEVEFAADGEEGVDVWKDFEPDLVFLDVLMPGLTGPQVLEKMQGQGRAKVVLISAYTGEFDSEKARQVGADLFIAKPFDDIFAVFKQAEMLMNV